jgi:hypothetical protein
MLKGNEMDAKAQLNCYGMLVEDIEQVYCNSITAKFSGLEMVVAGILSDCQEMIAMKNPTIPQPGTDDYIRKQMNVAKYVLSKIMDEKNAN